MSLKNKTGEDQRHGTTIWLCSNYWTFESDRQEAQRLQQAQLEYGVYAYIPGTQHTSEEVIQSLVGFDVRW